MIEAIWNEDTQEWEVADFSGTYFGDTASEARNAWYQALLARLDHLAKSVTDAGLIALS